MDTTLPVITRTSGERFAILSIFHGFVTDFSVPFLVSFFCSIYGRDREPSAPLPYPHLIYRHT